jgi:hypothetical protein
MVAPAVVKAEPRKNERRDKSLCTASLRPDFMQLPAISDY